MRLAGVVPLIKGGETTRQPHESLGNRVSCDQNQNNDPPTVLSQGLSGDFRGYPPTRQRDGDNVREEAQEPDFIPEDDIPSMGGDIRRP